MLTPSRSSAVITPSRGPGPSRTPKYSPDPSATSRGAASVMAARPHTASGRSTRARVTSVATPTTATFTSVPMPIGSLTTAIPATSTAPVTMMTAPMLSGVRSAAPSWKTVQGPWP